MADAVNTLKNVLPDSESMKQPSMIIAMVFLSLLIIGVIVYLVVKYTTGMKYYTIIASPKYMTKVSSPGTGSFSGFLQASDSVFPALSNGIEFTYAFWVYLNSVPLGSPKIIFQRGDDKANPIVFIGTRTNSLTFLLRTAFADTVNATLSTPSTTASTATAPTSNGMYMPLTVPGSSQGTSASASYVDISADPNDGCKVPYYASITIDYVPMQQWMHVAVSVSGLYAVVYTNGDIYKVINLTSIVSSAKTKCLVNNKTFPQSPQTFSTTAGPLYLGPSVPNMSPMDGAISKLVFFNYAITLADAKDLASVNPANTGALSGLNIPVGLQSPIYFIDNSTKAT